jgi:hypothetical protein
MSWQGQLKGDSLSWLLEPECPGVCYLAQRDLLDKQEDDAELPMTREEAHEWGPIADILAPMDEAGYWVEPGPGYYPKYRGSVWSIIALAQVGASREVDARIGRACDYLLDHALLPGGQFGIGGTPSTTVDCLQGNLCCALLALGCDPGRLETAFDWMARTTTGEGLASASDRHAPVRYYAGKCGPLFACGANDKQPCAWGAVKVMLAFSRWPAERRTPLIQRAISQGVDWLLSIDPVTAAYPCGYSAKPSGNWWKFGFPVYYVTDLLQLAEALVALGYGRDPRLARLLALIRDKQDDQGRWLLEYDYAGKMWVDFGPKRQPSKWVTLRALRLLKAAEAAGAGAVAVA